MCVVPIGYCLLGQKSQEQSVAQFQIVQLSLEIVRIARRARRSRLVVTLMRIRKPFAIWPFFAPLVRLARVSLGLTKSGPLRLDSFKRPMPAYALLLVLFVGLAGGAYASLALTQGVFSSKPSPPDFSIGIAPASSTAYPGSLATFTVRLRSMNGFAGSVNLTTVQNVTGINPLTNPNSASLLTGNATSTLTLSIGSTVPTGIYTINMTGSSGKLSHLAQIFLAVSPAPPPDFAISANPAVITLNRGTSATSSLTLTSISGFSGNIVISATVSPAIGNGPTVSLNPTSVTVTPGGTASSLLTVSTSGTTPRQGYTVFVIASSGALSHSTQIDLTVQ